MWRLWIIYSFWSWLFRSPRVFLKSQKKAKWKTLFFLSLMGRDLMPAGEVCNGRPRCYPTLGRPKKMARGSTEQGKFTLTPVIVSEVLSKLKADGWYLVATKGSHRQYKHQSKPGRVTVSGKPSDDVAPGTLNSIFKQAGWK